MDNSRKLLISQEILTKKGVAENEKKAVGEAWDKAKENWMSAVADWTATIEQSIESIQNRFVNALDLVFENLNRDLTNGEGLGYLEQE